MSSSTGVSAAKRTNIGRMTGIASHKRVSLVSSVIRMLAMTAKLLLKSAND